MNRRPNAKANWPAGVLTSAVFCALIVVTLLTAPASTEAESSHLQLYGWLQVGCLLILLGLVVTVAILTPVLRLNRWLPLSLLVGLGALCFSITRLAASSLLGVPMITPATISGLLAVALLSSLLAVFVARSEYRRVRRQAQIAFALDPLTALNNRHGFQQALGVLDRDAAVLAVIDVNQLKAMNDLFGHDAGDRHLQSVATALQRHLDQTALIARWGGDEFLAVFPDASPDAVRRTLTEVNAQILSPLPDVPAFSFGLSTLTADTPFERAFAIADYQMYSIKRRPSPATGSRLLDPGLYSFSTAIEALATPDEMVHVGLGLVRSLLQFDLATYADLQHGQLAILHVDTADHLAPPVLEHAVRFTPSPLAQQVLQTRATFVSIDYPTDPLATPQWIDLGVKTSVTTPILLRGEVVGLLTLMHLETWKVITPETERVLELAALRLGHALGLHEVAEATRHSLEGGLLGLGLALETRDLETHGHTERVVEMAGRLGLSLGLSGKALDDLRYGAFLHDIGKLAIADAVLLKPGPLMPAEWNVMKEHVTRGASIAAQIPQLSPGALEVIRHHHERWDGTGYPDGLAGEEIPMPARIFAVCDVFDALIHDRPYKQAWSLEQARVEILSQRGRQFCPQVVDAFLALSDPDARPAETRSV